FSDDPIPISVAITVEGDRLIVDYEGSSPQVKAALNATKSYTNSCSYLSVRCVLNGDVPNNEGIFRCIEVRAPEASVLNPVMPAPCAARALTGYRVMDAMFGALTQIVPDRVPAAGEGGNTVIAIGGYSADRKPFIIVDMICGCWGGRPDKDGVDAITNPSQNLSNTPIETLERQHPIRIEDYSLITDSCGAGEFRGGLGVRRSYRLLAEEAGLQLRSDRTKFAPYGLYGGQDGRKTVNWLEDVDGTRSQLPGKVTMPLTKGQLVIHEQAGAGGFGNPLERDAQRVVDDILDGKLSSAAGQMHYGVVLTPDGKGVDIAATLECRTARRLEWGSSDEV
ncbi:MAG: hydantoinase B/oxoprolinase family protein, partial [Sulfitobacter sp.]